MSNEEISRALSKGFPAADIKSRPDNRNLKYVEGHTVMRRLNDATNNTWDFRIVSQEMRPFGTTNRGDDRLMITAIVELTIPGLGTRQHMGVQVVNAENGGEDMWKGAITDGLKKAATLFGVALDLYGDDHANTPVRPQEAPRREQPAKAPDDATITDAALRALSELATKRGVTGEDLAVLIRWSYRAELLSDLTIAQGREIYTTINTAKTPELQEMIRKARAAEENTHNDSADIQARFDANHPRQNPMHV